MIDNFDRALLDWYHEEGRTFYWREQDLSPYEVLLVEVCLRRTTPESVDNSIQTIIDSIPTPIEAREKDIEELEGIFQPLGLQEKRAEEFKSMIENLFQEHDGSIPNDTDDLMDLDGIGRYIAEAVQVYAFEEPIVLVDPNTARVAERFFDVDFEDYPSNSDAIKKALRPSSWPDPAEYNWALIDLGSLLKRQSPDAPLEDYAR